MNKGRLEAFSDGVFAIVMTLLIFDIKVPELAQPVSDATLWRAIFEITPLLGAYFLSFAVLSALWINHHFIFHSFARAVDRHLNLLNLSYLSFVAFVPFSAHLIGTYDHNQPAAIVYGLNIFLIVLLSWAMIRYIRRHPELAHEGVSIRISNQARFRAQLSLISYLLGLAASFVFVPASLFFYIFPVVFNVIPGTLDLTERIFGLKLD
ncbi:MAG: DUF1211 domain-containing protein [Candidatus Kaiserbacteria bacterium]|nr:DUF1211 domain-containing protein [Candidatus Kaiserbacteria bacterium]